MKRNNAIKNVFPYVVLIVVIFFVLTVLNFGGNINHSITTGELLSELEKSNVTEITITPKSNDSVYYIEGKLANYKEKESFSAKVVAEDLTEITNYAKEHDLKVYETNKDPGSISLLYIIVNFLPLVIIIAACYVLFTKMAGSNKNSMDFGRSRAKLSEDGGSTKFSDVAGLKEEKEEVSELIDFLKNPKKFQKLGARIPKGVLLVGPP